MEGRGGGGLPKGWVHNLLMQTSAMGNSKIESFESYFCDIVTTRNDHPKYVCFQGELVLGTIYVFSISSGYWVRMCVGGGGSPKGLVRNLLRQSFIMGPSNLQYFKFYFLDVVTTQNDGPKYVKHVLGSIYVFFISFGYRVCLWGGGGSPK